MEDKSFQTASIFRWQQKRWMEQLQVTPATEESILVRAELSRTLLSLRWNTKTSNMWRMHGAMRCPCSPLPPVLVAVQDPGAPRSRLSWLGGVTPQPQPRTEPFVKAECTKSNRERFSATSKRRKLVTLPVPAAGSQTGKKGVSAHTHPDQHTLPDFGAEMGEGRNPRCVQLGKEKSYRQWSQTG